MIVELTPEHEALVHDYVRRGRYPDTAEVLDSAFALLRKREEAFEAFNKTLDDAAEEADRVGTFTIGEIMSEFEQEMAESKAKYAPAE